jgi:endonuclease-3
MNGDMEIVTTLIQRARDLLEGPLQPVRFTEDTGADEFLNRIDDYPHGFVLGCLMHQSGQMSARRAWRIPYEVAGQLQGHEFEHFFALSRESIDRMFLEGRLHRYPNRMSNFFYQAIQRIHNKYNGDASIIWKNSPSSATVVRRFLEFDGAGLKIATMAANILVRDFRITVSDKFSIDISVDQHVQRVFPRLGLVREDASREEIIYTARELSPSYPGVFDLPVWQIGQTWCHPQQPDCESCYIRPHCPTATDLD